MLSFPFDSRVEVVENPITHEPETQFDRAVSSQPMRHLISHLFTSGIMPDISSNYLVSAGTDGMTVVVHSGFAVLEGGLALETEDRTLEITAADTSLDRIDTVVLRWNENVDVRTCDLYIKAGTPASSPVRPELQRDNSIYEIGLADVFITRSTVTITNEKITDTRYETARCGVVSSISEFDTTFIYQQVQSDLANFKNEEQAEFIEWFNSVQDILDENVAAHIMNLLTTSNNKEFNFTYDSTSQKYGYTIDGVFYPFKTAHTGTYTATTRGSALDMGEDHEYRYVNTNGVPNVNTETYPSASGNITTNGTHDMGANNNYRYVKVNVSNKPAITGIASNTGVYPNALSYTFGATYSNVLVFISIARAGTTSVSPSISGSSWTLVRSAISSYIRSYCYKIDTANKGTVIKVNDAGATIDEASIIVTQMYTSS